MATDHIITEVQQRHLPKGQPIDSFEPKQRLRLGTLPSNPCSQGFLPIATQVQQGLKCSAV